MKSLKLEEFDQRKRASIQAITNFCELDKSPKGSVDEPIIQLVSFINAHEDLATTSSCSGRISLFHTKGRDTIQKGSGTWILSLHEPLKDENELEVNLVEGLKKLNEIPSTTVFKHEPFVLHIMCRTIEIAQSILKLAIEAGFRESGLSVGNKKIMLGIRTTSNVLECPVAKDGKIICGSEFLKYISIEANTRFNDNARRIKIFENSLREMFQQTSLDRQEIKKEETKEIKGLELEPLQIEEFKRWGHAIAVLDESRILIFGGWGEESESKHHRLSGTLVWDFKANLYRDIVSTGPSARTHHTLTRISDEIVILFGGRTSPSHPSNEHWLFSGKNEQWLKLNDISVPARYRHAACSNETTEQLFIFGGRTYNNEVLGDLWEVNYENDSFSARELIETKGETPGPRFSAAMTITNNNNILIHGGLSSTEASTGPSEVFVLNLETLCWFKIKCPNISWRFSHVWVNNWNSRTGFLIGGCSDIYHQKSLTGAEIVEIDYDHIIEARTLEFQNFKSDPRYPFLLLVQHQAVLLNDSLMIIGGGGTCFAFGSVFNPNVKINLKYEESLQASAQFVLYFACNKQNAVQVREKLIEHQVFDTNRKVEHDHSGRILFPITHADDLLEQSIFKRFGEVLQFDVDFKFERRKKTGTSVTKKSENLEHSLLHLFDGKKCKIEKVDDVLLVHSKELELPSIQPSTWKDLLDLYPGMTRVVWGNEIDKNAMRKSRNLLVYSLLPEERDCWVRVLENGVKFSWDMTKCMYSKGNVSEKLRFAKLIKDNEIVLDLFAGIGYFTVPALKLSKAQLVHACEWNPDAIKALRLNLKQNDVESRCIVHPGDCRRIINIADKIQADRISLGLLPDSKVGWAPAMACLSRNGGWLHVHANIPENEVILFGETLEKELSQLCIQFKGQNWQVKCFHIQRVKSYAPRVIHVVADVRCWNELGEFKKSSPGINFLPHRTTSRYFDKFGLDIADNLREIADQILCLQNQRQAQLLSADAQLLFKRTQKTISQGLT